MPISGRTIADRRALIDTGAEMTCIYSHDVTIDISSDVDYNPETETLLVGVEIDSQIYYTQCQYWNHPHGGTEHNAHRNGYTVELVGGVARETPTSIHHSPRTG